MYAACKTRQKIVVQIVVCVKKDDVSASRFPYSSVPRIGHPLVLMVE